MKTYIFICIIIFQNCFAQDFVKTDTIQLENIEYEVCHISFGKSSLTKYFKVITTDNKSFDKLEKEIIDCASKTKLEYTEFYLISICKESNTKSVLKLLYDKIDKDRMQQNLSTSIIQFKYDILSDKFTYLINEPRKTIEELKNYSINLKIKDVCEFVRK
jgi:hypothetical protein